MKFLKIPGLIIGLLVIAYFALYLMGPNKIYMERSIVINAPIDQVYDELITLKNQDTWSPWLEKDPNLKNTYEGPEKGVGSKISWTSEEVGNGSMWIVDAEENKMVKNEMDFGFPGEQYARFLLSQENGETKVTWTYEEEPKSYSKAAYAVMDLESMLSPDYEKGLDNLKKHIENKPKPANNDISIVETEPMTYFGMSGKVDPSSNEAISAEMGNLFGQIMQYMQSKNIHMAGMPMTFYKTMNNDEIEMICALPVNSDAMSDNKAVIMGEVNPGRAVKAIHGGDYAKLSSTHKDISNYMTENNLKATGMPYEIYVTDPGEVKDTALWVTQVFYPIE